MRVGRAALHQVVRAPEAPGAEALQAAAARPAAAGPLAEVPARPALRAARERVAVPRGNLAAVAPAAVALVLAASAALLVTPAAVHRRA